MRRYRKTTLPGACCVCGLYRPQEDKRAYDTRTIDEHGAYVIQTFVICTQCIREKEKQA